MSPLLALLLTVSLGHNFQVMCDQTISELPLTSSWQLMTHPETLRGRLQEGVCDYSGSGRSPGPHQGAGTASSRGAVKREKLPRP